MPLLDLLIPHLEPADENHDQPASDPACELSKRLKLQLQTSAARRKRWQNQCAARLRKEFPPQHEQVSMQSVLSEMDRFLTPDWKRSVSTEFVKDRRQQGRALWSYLCSRSIVFFSFVSVCGVSLPALFELS
jgi:hypothetical protein